MAFDSRLIMLRHFGKGAQGFKGTQGDGGRGRDSDVCACWRASTRMPSKVMISTRLALMDFGIEDFARTGTPGVRAASRATPAAILRFKKDLLEIPIVSCYVTAIKDTYFHTKMVLSQESQSSCSTAQGKSSYLPIVWDTIPIFQDCPPGVYPPISAEFVVVPFSMPP